MDAYLEYRARRGCQPGSPTHDSIVDVNKVATTVIADLDNVRRKSWALVRSDGLPERPPAGARLGLLVTEDGRGRFISSSDSRRDSECRSCPSRKGWRLHEHPEQPSGVRLDQPFELPSAIDRIDVRAGQAVVVQ